MNSINSHTHKKSTLLLLPGLIAWFFCMCLLPIPAWSQNQTSPESIPSERGGSEIMAPVVRGDTKNPAPVTAIKNATEELPTADDYFKNQSESNADFSWSNYFLVIGAMFLLLGVLWFVVWSLKKRNALPGSPMLSRSSFKVEASLPLGSRRALIVVRFLDSRYLLGVTEQQINLIKELGESEEVLPNAASSSPASAKAFAAILKKASKKSDN